MIKNKKGFTLVELLAVIVVLALLLIVATTKGFGAFDNTKNKLTSLNEKSVKEAVRMYLVDVENCDDDLNDAIELSQVINNSINMCSTLIEKLKTEPQSISLDELIDSNYISGTEIEKEKDNPDIFITAKIESSGSYTINTNFADNTALLASSTEVNFYAIKTPSNINKDNIVKIHFVKNVDCDKPGGNYCPVVSSSTSSHKIYTWVKDNILYIGSKYYIYAPEELSSFFQCNLSNRYKNIVEIVFDNFNTSKVKNMNNMFDNCEKITRLDLSKFDTSNVTEMGRVFGNCYSLTDLDLSSFDTSNVSNMISLFSNNRSLEELDLSSFNTSSVKKINFMFSGCGALKRVYVSKNLWNLDNVLDDYHKDVFGFNTNLVGGAGTSFNSSNPKNKTYARIDKGQNDPGYFTDIQQKSLISIVAQIESAAIQYGLDHGYNNYTTDESSDKLIEFDVNLSGFADKNNVLIADINEDGTFNAKDLTSLRNYIANKPGYEDKCSGVIKCDINGDGTINNDDPELLRNFNSGGYIRYVNVKTLIDEGYLEAGSDGKIRNPINPIKYLDNCPIQIYKKNNNIMASYIIKNNIKKVGYPKDYNVDTNVNYEDCWLGY